MALPSRNHTFPTTPASHHYHPPHHYRKKRGSNAPNIPGGPSGGGSGGAAGPLRQLLVDQEEEAGAMGGGSSRDASEEDNDAFSEHSDSASSVPRGLSQTLSSPTQLSRGIPTTARDRALVDSKAHRHNYTNAFAGSLPATATNRGSAGPSVSYPGPASSSQPSSQQMHTARKSFSTAAKDPGVAATLAQAAAALSSSSSNDLSRYAADDEDKSSGTNRAGRANSIDSSSTDDQIAPRATRRTAATPNTLLNLSTLPEPRGGISAATPEASTPRPPPFLSGDTDTSPFMANSNGLLRPDSSPLGWEADEMATQSTASSLSRHEGQRSALPIREATLEDGDASDGGTASPYDGDVEFAARTPVTQQVAGMQIGGQQQQMQQPAGPAKGGPGAPLNVVNRDQASALDELTVPGHGARGASEQGHGGVKDVICRVYSSATGLGAPTSTDGSAAPNAAAHPAAGALTSFNSSTSSPSSTQSPQGVTQQRHPSASDIHADLIRLNPPQVISRLLSHAAGKVNPTPVVSTGSPPDSNRSLAPTPTTPMRIYVQTFFDVPTLANCTSLLRTAKLCLGPGLADAVRIVAGVVVRGNPAEGGEEEEAIRGLELHQRAGLARSCRWVDEVIEGVPYFSLLDSNTTALLDDAGGKRGGAGADADAEAEAELSKFTRHIDTFWTARFVRGIEVQKEKPQQKPQQQQRPQPISGEGQATTLTAGESKESGVQVLLLPRC